MMAMRKTLSLALGFVLLGFGALALVTEGSRPQPPSRSEDKAAEAASPKRISPFILAARGKQRSARSKVYTNQDLERMFGPPEAAARAAKGSGELAPVVEPAATELRAGAPAATDQGDLPQVSEESAAERQRQIAESEKKVAQAQRRVSGLEGQRSAALNPFVPPHRAAWMAELDRAREELRKAERQLEQLRGDPH